MKTRRKRIKSLTERKCGGEKGKNKCREVCSRLVDVPDLQAFAVSTESTCSQLQAKARFPFSKQKSGQIGYLKLHFNKPNAARPA